MTCPICEGVGLVTDEPTPRPWRLPALPWSEDDRRLARIVLGNPVEVGVPLIGARPCTGCSEASGGFRTGELWTISAKSRQP